MSQDLKQLQAECDAAKQIVNELLLSNLQLKKNINLFNPQYQELQETNKKLEEELKNANQVLESLRKLNEEVENKEIIIDVLE